MAEKIVQKDTARQELVSGIARSVLNEFSESEPRDPHGRWTSGGGGGGEEPKIAVGDFRKQVKAAYPHVKVKVRTVSFADLARASKLVLSVEGERKGDLLHINKLAKMAGILPDGSARFYPEDLKAGKAVLEFSESEPRDSHGRWTSGGAGGEGSSLPKGVSQKQIDYLKNEFGKYEKIPAHRELDLARIIAKAPDDALRVLAKADIRHATTAAKSEMARREGAKAAGAAARPTTPEGHRDLNPEQYSHPAVGRKAEVIIGGKVKASGEVERVVPSRFGPLAVLVGDPKTSWLVGDLKLSAGGGGKEGSPAAGAAARPTTPEGHQLRIAKDTLKMPDAMAGVMGGPTKAQAEKTVAASQAERRREIGDVVGSASRQIAAQKQAKAGRTAELQRASDEVMAARAAGALTVGAVLAHKEAGAAAEAPKGPRPLHAIARDIHREWRAQKGGVHFAAKPYLEAMGSLKSVKDMYGADTGHSVVAYFLSNAAGFKGPRAKELKAELKGHVKKEHTFEDARSFRGRMVEKVVREYRK